MHGAAGGVGLAFLQLAKLIGGVTVWGRCSAANADVVRRYGATPIDYRSENFVPVIKAAGGGLDAAFDAIGGGHFLRSYRTLRRGGRLVAYGQSDALRGGRPNKLVGGFGYVGGILAPRLVSDGRSTGFYNAWALEKTEPSAYADDLATVLDLAADGSIAPRSVNVLPLADAGTALEQLAEGVTGKLVLDTRAD